MNLLLLCIAIFTFLMVLLAIVNNDSGGFAFFCVCVGTVLLLMAGPGFYWVVLNIDSIMLAAGAYIAIGVVWGCVFKWYLYNRAALKAYNREAAVGNRSKEILKQVHIPVFKQETERILTWMLFWPWSMVASLFQDLLRNVFLAVQRLFYGVMEGITNHVFKGIK